MKAQRFTIVHPWGLSEVSGLTAEQALKKCGNTSSSLAIFAEGVAVAPPQRTTGPYTALIGRLHESGGKAE